MTRTWYMTVRAAALAGCLCLAACGCAVTHGDYKTTTIAGGAYKCVSTGYGETKQINLFWVPVYKDY
jgi:hypothetical protein